MAIWIIISVPHITIAAEKQQLKWFKSNGKHTNELWWIKRRIGFGRPSVSLCVPPLCLVATRVCAATKEKKNEEEEEGVSRYNLCCRCWWCRFGYMFADKLFAMLIVALCAENLQAVKICTSFACAQKHAMLYMLYMHYIYTRIYA